jgi:hypothetical protein
MCPGCVDCACACAFVRYTYTHTHTHIHTHIHTRTHTHTHNISIYLLSRRHEDAALEAGLLKDMRARAALSATALPSVCAYTMHNAPDTYGPHPSVPGSV